MDIDRLHCEGYTILRKGVEIPDDVLKTSRRFIREGGVDIFNHNEGDLTRNDRKRKQRELVDTNEFDIFLRRVERIFAVEFPDHIHPPKWVILESKKGCQRQAAHADYLPTKSLANCQASNIPLLVMVAFQDNTFLEVWPRTIGLMTRSFAGKNIPSISCPPIHRVTLQLSKGDIVVFRGDLIHCGSAYPDRGNLRLHGYLDSLAVPRKKDTTWLVHRDAADDIKEVICTCIAEECEEHKER